MQAIRIDVLFVDDVPSCPLFFHPLFPSPKGLEPFCRFSWMLICRVAGIRFPNFLAYNIDIAVLSEACMKLFLIVFKATMSVSMLNNPFCCRSTLAQSDSFQPPDFFNDGFCVHGLALLGPGITVFAFLSCVSELADCPTQLKTLSRPSANRIGKPAERRANLSSLITFHVKNLENIKGGSVDVVPKEKRLVHTVIFTPYKQTISSNVILANRRVIH